MEERGVREKTTLNSTLSSIYIHKLISINWVTGEGPRDLPEELSSVRIPPPCPSSVENLKFDTIRHSSGDWSTRLGLLLPFEHIDYSYSSLSMSVECEVSWTEKHYVDSIKKLNESYYDNTILLDIRWFFYDRTKRNPYVSEDFEVHRKSLIIEE